MFKRELSLSFLVVCFIFACVPTASCISSSPIIYVAGDGSGDYNCFGHSDQVQINQALQFVAQNHSYTTVHLKGPFTYVVDSTILICSNTILEGDSNAVIKLADHAGWPTMKPLIQQMNNSGNENITVRGFEVNGNYAGNSEITLGRSYYNIMYFTYCNNVKVYNMYLHDGMGDGLRINQGKNVQFYNNTIYKLGHDGFFAIRSENIEAWNNSITCRTNSGLRIWNSNAVKLHDNEIDASYVGCTGGPGIQIEKSEGIMDSIEIYGNTFNSTYGPGIWIFNYDNSSETQNQGKNVKIHNNIFYNTGTNYGIDWVGGVVLSGFYDTLIENNVFDGTYHAAVSLTYPKSYSSVYLPKNEKCNTIVRNNIIENTQKHIKDTGGVGYGVANLLPYTHTVFLENNCLYNNIAGNYKNCSSTTDLYVTPLVADLKSHDYHLQSTTGRWDGNTWVKDRASSPCIDAGYRYSDYSNEPEPNGNRINIGSDGNTRYASKSESNRSKATVPTANFSCNETNGYAPLSVQFTDLSKNATEWKWDFGDGATSTQQNPVYMYSRSGKYTVKLAANNENGTNLKTAMITVFIQPVLPAANFSTNVTIGTVPLSVQFKDLSKNSAGWDWNFGDGAYSTQQNPKHVYSAAGNFTVNLTVSNVNGTNSKLAAINVQKSIPIITWSKPAYITYGTVLGSTQLKASASVPGTLVYTPASGTVLGAGIQRLRVDFTPTDFSNYTTTSKNVTIKVLNSIPTITWIKPGDIVYGTALSGTQLNATASVPGTFTYSPGSGTILRAGTNTMHVDFTPNDNANYTVASKNVTTNVQKSTPTINWNTPADIIYGTALGGIQLNASASVPGTFVYTPAAGTILSAGVRTLRIDFTPNDAANYTKVSKNRTINVLVKPVFPVANFSTNVTGGTVPLSVKFNDLSKYATAWNWKFGDGINSAQRNPVHTYSAAGNYTAMLTISNSNGTDSITSNISAVKERKISSLLGKYNNRLREASPENILPNSSFLDVGEMRDNGRYRDVLLFDLGEYAKDTQINNATLSLFWYYPGSSRLNDTIIEIYRPASIWNSIYVSWNKRNNGVAWNNPGGDWFDKNGVLQGKIPYAAFTLKAADFPSNSYCDFNVTDIINEYISSKYPNTGFFIKARNENDNYVAFYSPQCGNVSEVPKLKLVYS